MTDIGGGQQAANIENDPANQQQIKDQQAAAEAGNKDGGTAYPRVSEAHTRWVDDAVAPPHEFVGTQYAYNTLDEALARIDEARAADKYVMYMDPANASYVATLGPTEHRVTIED